MVKKIAAVFLLLLTIISAGSCYFGKKPENSEISPQLQTSFSAKDIIQKLIDNKSNENLDSVAYFEDELFQENCVKLYNIEYSQLEDGGIAYAGSGGLADEISIIKAKDISEDVVLQLLEKRVERREQDFTGYKPIEIDKIQNSCVFSSQGYSVLIISDNTEELEKQIKYILEQN